MARTKQAEVDLGINNQYNTTQKTAVIYLRGELLDKGTFEAQKKAGEMGCFRIMLRNEKYYDHTDQPVLNVSVCFTDDEDIKKDYERADIQVIDLAPLEVDPNKPPSSSKDVESLELKAMEQSDEIEKLKAENEALKNATQAQGQKGKDKAQGASAGT